MNTLGTKSNGPDYNQIAENYDNARPPIGVNLFLRAFSTSTTPLSDMHVLDVGCGTGNYSLALADHVQSVVGIDRSMGMIALAQEKLPTYSGQTSLNFTIGTMTETPFCDATFDGIMVNQALHHLGDEHSDGFPAHRKAFCEFARILKPDGVIVISTSSQEQCLHGFWFYHLILEAAQRLQKRFIPLPDLAQLLGNLGFCYVEKQVLKEMVLQGDSYFDPRGPLHNAWRDGDSAWSLATKEEFERALSTIRKLDEQGKLEEKLEEWDAARQHIGQVTFVCASRHLCPAWSNLHMEP
jgi:ubiquinone/menaquinone biosynthesis C-methylase UbiE